MNTRKIGGNIALVLGTLSLLTGVVDQASAQVIKPDPNIPPVYYPTGIYETGVFGTDGENLVGGGSSYTGVDTSVLPEANVSLIEYRDLNGGTTTSLSVQTGFRLTNPWWGPVPVTPVYADYTQISDLLSDIEQ